MFYIKENLFLFPIVPDEGVQGVTVRHPTNQTRVCWQRNDCITHNSRNKSKWDKRKWNYSQWIKKYIIEHVLPQMSLGSFLITSQQSVHQTKKLHDSFVLPKIFVALQQKHELGAITPYRTEISKKDHIHFSVFSTTFFSKQIFYYFTCNKQFSWSLFGRNDVKGGMNMSDVYHRFVRFVGSRYSQLQVPTHQQFGRHVLKL